MHRDVKALKLSLKVFNVLIKTSKKAVEVLEGIVLAVVRKIIFIVYHINPEVNSNSFEKAEDLNYSQRKLKIEPLINETLLPIKDFLDFRNIDVNDPVIISFFHHVIEINASD